MRHGGNLLSREVLKQLGVLPPEFPMIGQFCSGQAEKARWTRLQLVGMRTRRLRGREGFSLLVSVILRVSFHAGVH